MNTPPPLPQQRSIPLPTLTVDIPKGITRPILTVSATIVLADFLFLDHSPGLSIGIFGAFLGLLILGNRNTLPTGAWHWSAFLLLGLSCLQSARFLSLSNFLVIVTLLLCLSGFSAHHRWTKAWQRWSEGLFSMLKPIGAIGTFRILVQQKDSGKSKKPERYRNGFAVFFPALFLLFIFGWLLGSGNAVLGKWNAAFFTAVADFLSAIQFPTLRQCFWWITFGLIALIFVCPPGVSRLPAKLDRPWRQLGTAESSLRLHQWIASLVVLNLLFLLSNVIDVLFLWFSQELPAGVTHSQYVHQGVYALIATTLLSAILMALLTQHHETVSQNRWIRGLALTWMVQNLILISGVYVRLWIYVDAYGYTPKRAYVALFLALVVTGFALLGHAILKGKNIKWLIATNLVLVFSYFSVLQFIDVPQWVTQQNIGLYQQREIQYPEALFFRQVGSHSIPYLIAIYRQPQLESDRANALAELSRQEALLNRYEGYGWRAFQLRDGKNYERLAEFMGAREDGG